MDTCINMEEFRQKLIHTINTCGLSIGAALYIYKDVYHVLEASYQNTLKDELNSNPLTEEAEEIDLVHEEVAENGEQNND